MDNDANNGQALIRRDGRVDLQRAAEHAEPRYDMIYRIEEGKRLQLAAEQEIQRKSQRNKALVWLILVPIVTIAGMYTAFTRPWINAIAIFLGILAVLAYRRGSKSELVRLFTKFTGNPIFLITWGVMYWGGGGRLPLLVIILGFFMACWSMFTPRRNNGLHMLD